MGNTQLSPKMMQSLVWRCIGPPRGGRVVAVAGHPTDLMTFYFGACAGGVWKTTDGGVYWENISDGDFTSSAVGAIAVAESNPNVIYAGSGESTLRLDVSYGDGIYKTTDGGKTWSNMGLHDSHYIGKIRVHPYNPDVVYVAALGHAFGPNQQRGVFRSKDGGLTWEKILFKSDKAGAVDLAIDPTNPLILYASIYETVRTFWSLSSGGPDSGLWKSVDGGDSWTDITDNPGLPTGLKGKIGVTISPANPDRIWAIIEAEGNKAGVYRSDDGGATWEQLSDNRELIQRPWYYCHIFADPQNADTVYVNNLRMWKSTDGGKNYTEITTPHGDNHDLWIDPHDPQRMVEGNDGGACVSFNGGATWSTIYNQLTGQFYHVAVDNQYPYRVYGTQQDNSSISVPSATEKGAIPWTDCYAAGTGESGYITVHPQDPDIVYIGAVGSSPGGGGALQRYDHRTKQIRLVTVWPEMYTGWGAKDFKYRFAWTFPILFSPHDPRVLYSTGNHIFRTTDEGSSWEPISPDLTRADESKLVASGGPITLDTSGAEHYGTVYALAESPCEPGVLWAGSDDGLVHISRNGGGNQSKDWQNITPPDLPEWTLISVIETSSQNPATAYIAATRYKLDDYNPYLYKTSDYGKTWQRIDNSFPTYAETPQITRVIRQDPVQPGLLYVGTETGLYISLDDGATWQRMESNLPVAPIYDLLVKDDDLVVATHGRAFWILDDVTPFRELAAGRVQSHIHLFPPRITTQQTLGWSVDLFRGPGTNYSMGLGAAIAFRDEKGPNGEQIRTFLDGGENPPDGAIVYFTLPENADTSTGQSIDQPLSLTFLDEHGARIRIFSSETTQTPQSVNNAGETDDHSLPHKPGLNRFVWNLRHSDVVKVAGDFATETSTTGPKIAPGDYQVQLSVGDQTLTEQFSVRADPNLDISPENLQAQFELNMQIHHKIEQVHEAINQLRHVRKQVAEWGRRAQETEGNERVAAAAAGLQNAITAVEKELVQTEAKSSSDRLRHKSRLNAKLTALLSVVSSADAAPTKQAYEVFAHLSARVDEQLGRLYHLYAEDIPQFNELVTDTGLPPVGLGQTATTVP